MFWVFDVSAPKGLFPPEPEAYTGPKLKVAIIGSGLAGMSTAVELLEQGHEVPSSFSEILFYQSRHVVNSSGRSIGTAGEGNLFLVVC